MHLFNKDNIQIKSSRFLHTFSHPDKPYNSANRINSSRRGEEGDSSAISQSSTSINSAYYYKSSSSNSTVFSVYLHEKSHSTHRINSSTRNLQEILQLQGSSRAYRYKASSSNCSPCIQAFYMAETLLVTLKGLPGFQ